MVSISESKPDLQGTCTQKFNGNYAVIGVFRAWYTWVSPERRSRVVFW